MPKKISLHVVLAVQFVAQVVGVVSLVGYLSYQSGQHTVEQLADELIIEMSRHTERHLDDYLGRAQKINHANLAAFEAGILDLNDYATLGKYFYRQVRLFDFAYVNFGGEDGSFIGAGYGIDHNLELAEIPRANSDAIQVFSVDEQGNRLELLETTPNSQTNNAPWYSDAVAAGRSLWSAVYTWGDLPNRISISASTPVYDDQQKLLGILGVDVGLNQLSQFLRQMKGQHPGSVVFIVERSGLLIASSENESSAPIINGKATRLNALDSQNPLIHTILQELMHRYGSLQAIAEPQLLHPDLAQASFAGISPYIDEYGLDWLIITVVPESEFLNAIQTNFRRTAGLCGLALFGAISSGIWTSRRITRSLSQLTQATQAFAKGRLVQPFKATCIREVATLSDAFQGMAKSLRQAEQLRQNYERDLERKVAEQTAALRKTTAQLRAAQRIAQVGSWELDVATRKVTWSQELIRIVGGSSCCPEQFPSSILEITHPGDKEALRQAVEAAIAHGTSYRVEHRIIRPNGEIRWLVSRGEALYDDQGQVGALAGTAADISDLKEVEIRLQESERRYASLAEAVPVGIFRHDADDNCTYINDRCRQISGLTPETAQGSGWRTALHPDDRNRVIAEWEQSFREDRPFRLEYRFQRPDGKVKWAYTQSAIEEDADGRVIGYVGTITDISDLKQAEYKLHRYERIVSATADGISVVDHNYVYQMVNQTYLDRTGKTYEEIVGHSVSDLLGEAEFLSQIKPRLDRCLAGEVVQYEDWFDYLNVGRRFVSVNYAPYREVDGSISGVLVSTRDITERKQIETELQASRAYYQAIIADQTELICRFLPDGILTFVNEAYCAFFRKSSEELIGHSFTPLIPDEDKEIPLRTFNNLSVDNPVGSCEHRVIAPDGSIRWQQWTNRALFDSEGNFIEFQAVGRDITALKDAKASIQRHLSTIEASIDGISILRDGRYIYLNQSKVNLFGYDQVEDLLGQPWQMLYPPQEVRHLQDEVSSHVRQHGFWRGETIGKRRDNTLFPMEISLTLTPTGDIIRVCRDITDSKNVQQQLQQLNQALEAKVEERTAALQEREQFLKTLLDTFPLSVFWKDRNSVFLGCNRLFLQHAGLESVPDIIGKTDYDMPWGSTEAEAYRADDREVIESAAAKLGIIETQRTADGKQIWIETSKVPLYDLDGQVIGVLGTYQDITDRRQAEMQLQQTNQALARATRLKDEFLANMSHELRTPLNAILGMAEGLQDSVFGEINKAQSTALQTIEYSGAHLLELINDILDVAKIESGQIKLERRYTAVTLLCQSSLAFIKQQALKKRIQLETKLPNNLPDVCLDERRIRQVLINVLTNAVKFTPEEGRITLAASCHPLPGEPEAADSRPKILLRIAVADTGIGIAPDQISKLFQPFVQIDSALNRQYTGTGLGLALVKRLIELHDGQVKVSSKLGVGSCFTVELPCATAEPLHPEPTPQPEPRLDLNQPKPATYPLILLAEDNEANMRTITSYLSAKGYCILLAKTGEEAIVLARTKGPALILMDIQMPGVDGLEAIRQIRGDHNLADVPIIALTALAMAGDRERCLAAGANDYLSKPIKLKQLAATIQQLLSS